MLEVKIEKILPVTEARDSFNKLIDEVEGTDELYVLTKNGKPAAVLVGVHHLEKLTGTSQEELMDQTNTAAPNDDNAAPISTTTNPTDGMTASDASATQDTPIVNSTTPAPEITLDQATTDSLSEKEPEKPASEEASSISLESTQAPLSAPSTSPEMQQSGATASPFGSPATPAKEDNTPAEDPLDFLSDSDADATPAVSETPSATNTPMSSPSAMPASTPAQTPATAEPMPAPATPETPTSNPTPPTQSGM